jgi:hypothetical protein
MKKLILLLILVMAIPVVAQEPEAKTQWVLEDSDQILLQRFAQEYKEEFEKMVKMFREENNIPDEAIFNVVPNIQITFGAEPMFAIPKPKEEKNNAKN